MSQIKTLSWLLIFAFALNLLWGLQAMAADGGGSPSSSGGFSTRSARQKEASRWTLQEWLDQKDRSHLEDLWLSLHTSSPFEFMIGGSYLSYATSVDTPKSVNQYTSSSGEVRAYAQFVGLTAEYQNNTQEIMNDLSGMLNIRLLGDSMQNSSITISGGQRTRTVLVNSATVLERNLFSQIALQIYLTKYFGIDGFYRNYSPLYNTAIAQTISGDAAEAGVFLDFAALRLFGAWFQDRQKNVDDITKVENNLNRVGIKSGLKFFF